MTLTKEIARHFRDVYFGDNWTEVNLKNTLADISWRQAILNVGNLHSIAALVFHINYYVDPALKVLQGQPLTASDKYSFDLPRIVSAGDWQKLINKALTEAELLASQIEQLDEARLSEDFAGSLYGSCYRNLQGILEHTYYHLGQISLIKKILNDTKAAG